MAVVWAIVRRELIAHFTAPLAWLVLAVWTLTTNLAFILALPEADAFSAMPLYVASLQTGFVVLLLLGPALTMNSFASEQVQGTMQLLLTVPVREWALVLGKFLAALAMFLVLVAATAPQLVVVHFISDLGGWHVVSGYSGMILFSALCAALGTWISLLVPQPVTAYVITFGLLVVFTLLGLHAQMHPVGEGFFHHLSAALGLGPRIGGFIVGLPRLADVLWFIAGTLACLVLAHGALLTRRLHG